MPQLVISYRSIELVRICKVLAIADRRLSSVRDGTCYFTEHQTWTSSTQTVVTSGSVCRTRCTSGPCLVHGGTYNIAARSIVTHVKFVVPAVGTIIRCKSTANLIRIGPHYLGVVTCTGSEPGNMELQ
jgi:hypothetical protein